MILNAILEDDAQDGKTKADAAYTNPVTYPLLSTAKAKVQTAAKADAAPTTPTLPISERLDSYLIALSDEELAKIIVFSKDWNSNARQCFVSQVAIYAIFRIISLEKLQSLRPFIEAMPNFTAYTEKHYERVNRLYQASYLLDYMSSLMTLMPIEETGSGKKQNTALSKLKLSDKAINSLNIIDEDDFVPNIFGNSNTAMDGDGDDSESSDDDDNELVKGASKKIVSAVVDNTVDAKERTEPSSKRRSLSKEKSLSEAEESTATQIKTKKRRKEI
jgi:hypothetical protein